MAAFVGQNTDVDASAEVLIGASTPIIYGVRVKALPGNTGVIYVGLDNTVSATNGYPLSAGQEAAFDVGWVPSSDANGIYVIASVANQGVAYWGL